MVKYLVLAVFVAVMIGVGLYSKSKVKNVKDFVLGGRQMGPWLTAFAYGTTYFSAVIFIGYAGRTGWGFGLSAIWIGIGNAILGSLLAWLVLAKRTRKMTRELDASTMPEFFEKRYGSRFMKIFASLIIFIFLVPYSASVYQGLGYLFERAFGIPFIYCMMAMAILTGIYLLLGGYVATALNDFIQGIVMIIGVVLMIYFVLSNPAVGGLGEGISKLSKIPETGGSLTSILGGAPFNLLSLVMLTSLGTWGLPQMIHKFYVIKDESAIKKATIVSTLFALLVGAGAYFTGAFGRLFFIYNNEPVPSNLDNVMPKVLEWALPDALFGIIIVLVLSASMSTLSSIVLVSSSSISLDLVKGVIFPKMPEDKIMKLMRWLCALFVAFSFFVAAIPSAIITLMSFSWGTIAGSFLAPFIYGLFWKGTTKVGAIAGMLTGFISSIGGALIFGLDTSIAPALGAFSMLISLVAIPVANIISAKVIAAKAQLATGKAIES